MVWVTAVGPTRSRRGHSFSCTCAARAQRTCMQQVLQWTQRVRVQGARSATLLELHCKIIRVWGQRVGLWQG